MIHISEASDRTSCNWCPAVTPNSEIARRVKGTHKITPCIYNVGRVGGYGAPVLGLCINCLEEFAAQVVILKKSVTLPQLRKRAGV